MEVTKQTKRKRLAKVLGCAILTPVSLFILLTLLPWSCGLCADVNKGEAYSANDKYLARIYERNCGATTGFLTHVNLRSKWDYFNTVWVGTITQGQVFSIGCDTEVKLRWKNDSNLEIQYRPCARTDESHKVLLRDEVWNNITINYVELSPEEKK
jgi:hypothetical protein